MDRARSTHIAGVALLGLEALRLARRPTAIAIPLPLTACSRCSARGSGSSMARTNTSSTTSTRIGGIFVKEMLALDGLWTGDTNSMHPRYPPGAPLWQYLFNAFLPPSEGPGRT